VTCDQVDQIRNAARAYESLDVVYNLPPGPNSNSFAEWVLDRAGIPTAGIATPAGALGWGYYINNPGQRSRPAAVTRRVDQMQCQAPVRAARTWRQMITLIRDAETRLIGCGINSVEERLHILRGIYYGTTWSRDYSAERSPVRNFFFQQYTDTSEPSDARSCLPCELFLALSRSQDVQGVDFGHILIALDARRSQTAREQPRMLEGVTGLEASTWGGDLGGAAARVALDRVTNPRKPAVDYFHLSNDYGATSNLEGDVAGYVIAAAAATPGTASAFTLAPGRTIADALEEYFFPPRGTTGGSNSRCRVFLQALGGTFSPSGSLTNQTTLIPSVANRIHNFGCVYMANYLRQRGRLDPVRMETASRHIVGASREVAEIFIDALVYCTSHPGSPIAARGRGPTPSPIGSPSCSVARAGARVIGPAQELLERGRQGAGELLEEGGELLERAGSEAERIRREAERRLRQYIPF
jgi:hypothetical protein